MQDNLLEMSPRIFHSKEEADEIANQLKKVIDS